MDRTLIYLAGGLALLAVAAAAGVALFLRPTAVETTEVVRTCPGSSRLQPWFPWSLAVSGTLR